MRPRRRWAWEWRRGPLAVSVDLANLNRPYVQVDEERKWAEVAYGNGNSDPVLSVAWLRRGARP